MNGAESVVATLVGGGVDLCFANPGTTEMPFVAALDSVGGVRPILCLFEGVATGAADGYARMADKPAATLLHCGAGLANGIANLHNAKRANSPIVNLVGDLATGARGRETPLTADVEGLARPVSAWVRTAKDAASIATDAAAAIQAAGKVGGKIATLIMPSDCCSDEGGVPASPAPLPPPSIGGERVDLATQILRAHGASVALILGGAALRSGPLELADRIARATGARILAPSAISRMERGAGRVAPARIPTPVDQGLAALAGIRHVLLVGAPEPVPFFLYPGKPPTLVPEGAVIHRIADADVAGLAIAMIADQVGPAALAAMVTADRPEAASGSIGAAAVARSIAALLPDHAIIVDESVSLGRDLYGETAGAAPHDWLQVTGGAIGDGPPLAIGAALAAPGRRVVNVEGDGSAMYTVQALWTQARERLDVTTVILSNRSYAVLHHELARAGKSGGAATRALLDMTDPALDWPSLARAMGVPGARVTNMDEFNAVFASANKAPGPFLIEVVFP